MAEAEIRKPPFSAEDIIPSLEERAGERIYHEYVIVKTICSSAVSYEPFFEKMMQSIPDSVLGLSFQNFLGKPLAIDFSFRRKLFQGARQIKDKTGYVEEIISAGVGEPLREMTLFCAATCRGDSASLETRIKEIVKKYGASFTEEDASAVSSFVRQIFANEDAKKMVCGLAIEQPPKWGERVLEIADAVGSYNLVKKNLVGSAIVDTYLEYSQKAKELANQGGFSPGHLLRKDGPFGKVYPRLRDDIFFRHLFKAAEPFTLYSSEYGMGCTSIKYFKFHDIPPLVALANENRIHLLSPRERAVAFFEGDGGASPVLDISAVLQDAEKFRIECKQPYKKSQQDRFVEHPLIGEPCYTAVMIKDCFRKRGPAAQQIRDFARQEGRLIRPGEYGIPAREKDTLYIPKSVAAKLIEKHNLPVTIFQLEKAYGF